MTDEQKAAILEEARRTLQRIETLTANSRRADRLRDSERRWQIPEPEPEPREQLLDMFPPALIDALDRRFREMVEMQRSVVAAAIGEAVAQLLNELEDELVAEINKMVDVKVGELRGEMNVLRSADREREGVVDLPADFRLKRVTG
jgi:hypothetical protein